MPIQNTLSYEVSVTLFVISSLELLVLYYAFKRKKATWEHLWVMTLETFGYGCAALVPEAPFFTLALTNGHVIPWLRYVGWMLTCPVLLMGLVTIGTLAQQKSSEATQSKHSSPTSIQLVPILVANLVMIVLGVTSAAIDNTGLQRVLFCLAVAAGGVVFISAAQVFCVLFTYLQQKCVAQPENSAARAAKWLSAVLPAVFFSGWLLFPIGFAIGPNFGGYAAAEEETLIYFVGDIFSKNSYIALMVVFKHYFLKCTHIQPGSGQELMAPSPQAGPSQQAGPSPQAVRRWYDHEHVPSPLGRNVLHLYDEEHAPSPLGRQAPSPECLSRLGHQRLAAEALSPPP